MRKFLVLSLLVLCSLGIAGCTGRDTTVVLSDAAGFEVSYDSSGDDPKESSEALADGTADSSFAKETEAVETETAKSVIYVYVCGAVNNPGVYELSEGSRVTDAVEAAGGFGVGADETYVNLAALLNDGVKLMIPTAEESAGAASAGIDSFDAPAGSDGGRGLININSATKEQLTTLPGIGEATAEKIITYRQEHGAFKALEDIMNVSGIKEKLFSKIKDHITV